jgi:hypothetical protein
LAKYAQSLGMFDGSNTPDFIAVDRFEADGFVKRSYENGYCYGPREWGRFFDFCAALSTCLQVQVMAWQIPSSRIPSIYDCVDDNIDRQKWGTGGSYLLGDPLIKDDYRNVHPEILDLQLSNNFPLMDKTPKDIFTRSEPFDLTVPVYKDFFRRGIFAVLLGGDDTAGSIWPKCALDVTQSGSVHEEPYSTGVAILYRLEVSSNRSSKASNFTRSRTRTPFQLVLQESA